MTFSAGSMPTAAELNDIQVLAITPNENDLVGWSYDPVHAVSSVGPAAGAIVLVRIPVRAGVTISNVIMAVATGGTSLTASQNYAGLYSSAGSRLALTADQSGVWNSTGIKTMALTSTYTPAAGVTWVWAAMLANASGSTPAFARTGALALADLASAGLTASERRYGTYGSGQTSLPSSITPASIAAITNSTYWIGLS